MTTALSSRFVEDFWQRVYVRGAHDCWPFLGAKCALGYGSMGCRGRTLAAHRIALTISDGPSSLWALHHCDNPSCCNPLHLYWGSPADNTGDMRRRGRGPVTPSGTANPGFNDLLGRDFGRWTVVMLHGFRAGGALWLCRCSCGTERVVRAHSLRNGGSQSCGCIGREKCIAARLARLPNMSGQRFDRLVVVALHPVRAAQSARRWICRCDCGVETVVRTTDLTAGKTRSCGCLKSEVARAHAHQLNAARRAS